ncbi:hypothetical protein D3C78_1323130 [compost metagenome]
MPRAGPVQCRRFFQRIIDGFEIALDGPDVQRDAAHIGENDPAVGVQTDKRNVLAQTIKQRIQRHQRQYRREHLENQHAFQQGAFTAKTHAGKGIGTGGRQRDDADGGDHRDLDRVPQPQQDRERRWGDAAIGVRHAHAECQPPVIPGNLFRYQAAGGEVARAQRDSDDHQQREHDQGDKAQHQCMGYPQAQTLGFGLDHSHYFSP